VQGIRKIGTMAAITAFLIFSLASMAQGQQKTQDATKEGTLVVMANGFKSGGGQFIMNVFVSKAGYPLDSSKALRKVIGEVTHETMEISVESIPFGSYAVTVLHDADSSGKMTTGFLGMPKEAIGISNNPRSYFGTPDYEDAIFTFKEDKMTISINLHSH